MSRPALALRILFPLGAMATVACSNQSPIEPSPASTAASTALKGPQLLPGLYWLTFHDNSGAEVPSLPVLEEIVLRAHVTDSSGQPAQSGSVTFEYCSYRGLPTNDITRADEAPMSECATGAARWRGLLRTNVNQAGEAAMNFGFVRIPRTIGFRCKYSGGKNSSIASGQCAPRDFTITAQ